MTLEELSSLLTLRTDRTVLRFPTGAFEREAERLGPFVKVDPKKTPATTFAGVPVVVDDRLPPNKFAIVRTAGDGLEFWTLCEIGNPQS